MKKILVIIISILLGHVPVHCMKPNQKTIKKLAKIANHVRPSKLNKLDKSEKTLSMEENPIFTQHRKILAQNLQQPYTCNYTAPAYGKEETSPIEVFEDDAWLNALSSAEESSNT